MTLTISWTGEINELPIFVKTLTGFTKHEMAGKTHVRLSEETKEEIHTLWDNGLRPKEIADALEISDGRQVAGIIRGSQKSPRGEKGTTKQLQNSLKLPGDEPFIQGNYPANFEEAPVQPKSEEVLTLSEAGRDKYGRWEVEISPAIDQEIKEMDAGGLTCRAISEEFAKRDIFLTWQRVRGRIAYMARCRTVEAKAKAKAIQEVTNEVDSKVTLPKADILPPLLVGVGDSNSQIGKKNLPETGAKAKPTNLLSPAASRQVDHRGGPDENLTESAENRPTPKAYTPAVLNGRIWDLHLAGMESDEISEELQNEGYYFSADAVKARLLKMGAG